MRSLLRPAVLARTVALVVLVGCAGGDGPTPSPEPTPRAPVSNVVISPSSASVVVGTSQQFTAVATDAAGNVLNDRGMAWSSNSNIATVSQSGLVTAVSVGGPLTITATSEQRSGTATIMIIPVPVSTVEIVPLGPRTILVGGSLTFGAVTKDSAGNVLSGREIAWASSNRDVARVDSSGVVTGVSAGGPVTITATSEGRAGVATITVMRVPVRSVGIAPPGPHKLQVGNTLDLTAVATDSAGNLLTGRAVTWNSSNSEVASVNATGTVTAKTAGGPITITATSEEKTGTTEVTVVPVPVYSVEISPPGPHSLQMGDSLHLIAVAKDAAGNLLTGRAVTWKSANPGVASVSPTGLVGAVAVGGPVSITATSEEKVGTVQVMINPPPFAVALPDGRVRIHPEVIRRSAGFDLGRPLWLGWIGNEFLEPFTKDYSGLTPSRMQRISRAPDGWYETATPVVGGCFTVLQLVGSERRWANLSLWKGRPGILLYRDTAVMRLADDGFAEQRLRSWVQLFMRDNHRYARFAPDVLPLDPEVITQQWKLVGSANWNYPEGRPTKTMADGSIETDVSGLRRFANITARTAGDTAVWALYGHLGNGKIDLSGASCEAPGTGFRHPDVRVNADGAGLWLDPEMPDNPPYLNRNGSEGAVWWSDPARPPSDVVLGSGFTAATPWFTIVDDPRALEPSRVEIDYVRLHVRANGRDSVLSRNEYNVSDTRVGGSYYQRSDTVPWFGPAIGRIADVSRIDNDALILRVGDGQGPKWIWHIWMHDPWRAPDGNIRYRRTLPPGTDLVWVEARFRIVGAAAVQVGFDFYRNIVQDGCDANNDSTYVPEKEDGLCEGGKSRYLFQTFENDGWITVTSNATSWNVSPVQESSPSAQVVQGRASRSRRRH